MRAPDFGMTEMRLCLEGDNGFMAMASVFVGGGGREEGVGLGGREGRGPRRGRMEGGSEGGGGYSCGTPKLTKMHACAIALLHTSSCTMYKTS